MEKKTVTKGFAIVVLDRGFVYVGEVSIDDEWCVIENARNIRYWGTKNGLGGLALNGPTSDTKLDKCGTVRARVSQLNHIMETEQGKWKM